MFHIKHKRERTPGRLLERNHDSYRKGVLDVDSKKQIIPPAPTQKFKDESVDAAEI